MTSTTTRTPSIGRIVHYTLTTDDVRRVVDARTTKLDSGIIPQGYAPSPGSVLPMIVTFTSGPAGDFIAGQVFLDCSETLYVEGVRESYSLHGCWFWPERQGPGLPYSAFEL